MREAGRRGRREGGRGRERVLHLGDITPHVQLELSYLSPWWWQEVCLEGGVRRAAGEVRECWGLSKLVIADEGGEGGMQSAVEVTSWFIDSWGGHLDLSWRSPWRECEILLPSYLTLNGKWSRKVLKLFSHSVRCFFVNRHQDSL